MRDSDGSVSLQVSLTSSHLQIRLRAWKMIPSGVTDGLKM
jgi:hypothetical protein